MSVLQPPSYRVRYEISIPDPSRIPHDQSPRMITMIQSTIFFSFHICFSGKTLCESYTIKTQVN